MKGQTEKSGIDKLNQMRCENHMQKSVLVLNNAACYWKTIERCFLAAKTYLCNNVSLSNYCFCHIVDLFYNIKFTHVLNE